MALNLPWAIERLKHLIGQSYTTVAPLRGGGDHVYDRTLTVDNASASTATEPGNPGVVSLAPDNNTTARNMAATPAAVAAQIRAAVAGMLRIQTGAGVGQMLELQPTTTGSVGQRITRITLPSGGRWVYFGHLVGWQSNSMWDAPRMLPISQWNGTDISGDNYTVIGYSVYGINIAGGTIIATGSNLVSTSGISQVIAWRVS